MITKSRYYQPFSRKSRLYSQHKNLGLTTEKELYLSPQPSIEHDKSRYKLVPLRDRDIMKSHSPKRQETPSSRQRDYINYDIAQLQAELQYKRRIRNSMERPKIHYQSAYFEQDEEQRLPRWKMPTRIKTRPEQDLSSIWQNPDVFRSTARKNLKIYKLKSKRVPQEDNHILHQAGDLPVIDRIRWGTSSRLKNKQYLYQYVRTPIRNYSRYKKYFGVGLRNFRKVAHVILFTIYLRNFNERMRRNREGFFQRYVKEQVKQKLLHLKAYFIQHSQPLFLAIIEQHNFDYSLLEKEGSALKKQKINALKKLVQLQITCLERSVRTMANKQFFSDLIYYMCKHGNYASSYAMNTAEELSLCCISEQHGYMRGDKYLQCSAIVSLVFIKILLFNILLQPSKIPLFTNTNNQEIVFKNLALIANVLYELFIDIQDNFLEKSPPLYKIGNWKDCKMSIKSAQSMTVKSGLYKKNELISGLHSHQYVKQTYGTKFMVEYKNTLEQLVKLIHLNIVSVHERIRKKYY